MKLNGEYNEKVFVQGQEFDTGIKIDNIDDNAKERLVGQVYHPTTGEIVPGASAYIGENGTIHIKMPKGALKKDPTGLKYVVDDESIFSTDAYKGLQNLDVKFFARPRTADEFKAIVKGNEAGFYTETGAGTKKINHDGKEVEVDLQGIDRYDHYNLIGGFKLNLDDTRYYTQKFLDGNNEETDDHKFSRVNPGQDFEVKIDNPADDELDKTRKTDGEMNKAYEAGQASGKLNDEFLEVANRQIAENLGVDYDEFMSSDDYKDNRWSIDGSADNISHFKIHAPKNAKAGDFLAVPVEYTYTNGSTDTHWFHFVVQESNNNRPEYLAEVGPQGNVLVNNPIIPHKEQDLKKNQPESYELIGDTFKDNKGNVWNVSINQKTGAVTATLPVKLPGGKEINGGEKLTVPVKVKYTDKDTKEEKTEEINAQFIATKQHKTLTNETKTSEIPYETKVEYDENLPEGYFQETQAGQKGELKISFVQDTLNGKKGIFQQDGTFKEGESQIVVETTKEPTPRIIKIGTKPASTTVEIPFDTEYVPDNTLDVGKTELVNDGEKGEVTITTTRNEDGTITVNQNVTKEAKNKKIKIGTKTQGQLEDTDKIPFKYKVEFDPDFYTNYPDATDNYKIVTPGKEGENTKTWTIVNSQKVGDPKVEITDPVDAVIKVGQKDYTGTVTNTVTKEIPYTVKVVKNPELEAGKSNVKQKGVAGSKTFEYSGEIFNGELKEGTQFTEKEVADKYVAPQEEIIEIGTKPAENSKTIDSNVEVDVDITYDPKVDKGVVNIGDLTPGKVTTVVKNEYDPETGEIVTTEETKVSNPSRKVVIGTKDFTSSYTEVDNKVTPYKTEIQFDDNMKEGEQETVQTGVDGVVTTETEVTIVNGVPTKGDPKITKSQEVQNQIIRVGTRTDGKHSYTEKLPYKYEIEYDENLEAGKYVIDVEGAEGTKTTEWTIKNSKVVEGSANVTEHTPATNAKIRVGKKDFTGNVSHEVTEEIPYDVKVIEDPTMIAGTSEVVTEGKAGSKTTKYTQAVKNGEADGELKSDVTAETKPTQQVIKVGTKPAENNKDYDKDVDVKVEYVYDENLDKGVVKVGDLTKGKVEIKTVNKYDPKTGEVTTTEEEKVTEATQKIIVGTKDFTGTYKYEKTCPLPFEVTITEDPNLAKGEKVVDQEGQAGSKTTYYEQDIKNGQPDGEARELTEKTTIQEPKNHIVRIGTKVAESSTVKTVDREIPFETKYIYDDTMDAGSEKVESEGKVGKEKVTITTKITDGTGEASEETKTITEKEDRVVRIGTKPVTKVVEKPFNTEYVYDENLESGKTEEVTPGKNGKVTITTTYDKDQKKVLTSETEEAGQNRVVKIGGKTNGTHTYTNKKPFDVEVRVNPELPKGEHNVIQEGVEGEEEVTVTIENSKVTETSEPKETKAPVNEIIEVGSEDYTGTLEYTDKDTVPFETEVTIDPSLAPNEIVEDQAGVLGEKETKITRTITNGQAGEEVRGEETQTKDPVTRKIRVGAKSDGTHTYTNKKPFDVEVRVNPDLAKGEYNVIQEGVEGEEEVTVTIENSKVTNTSEPKETKAPVNEIIEVGSEDYTGTFETKKTSPVEFETEYVVDNSLEPGTTVVEQEGSLGEETTTVTHKIENGKVVESTEGEPTQTKAPTKRIVKVGPAKTDGTHTYTNKKPFDVEVKVNPNLAKGEYKVIQEGVEGEEEVTVTIENSKVTETSEPKETKAPVKEIIEVGSADFTGTVEYVDKDPIPYETEVTVDPSLKPGEIVEDQKGELGEQETKITRTITNGEAGEENRGETKVTKEPVNRKIRVGSKTTGQYKETETIPFETEIRTDSSIPKGEWKYAVVDGVPQTGKNGLKERTITIENSKVTETSDFTTIEESRNAVILVGDKSFKGVVEHKEEIPFEYTVEYDPDFYKNYPNAKDNYKIVTEGEPGEKTTKWTIKDSKIVGDPEETITKEPVNAVIKVGQKDYKGTFETKITNPVPFETEYIEDETLEPGKTVVEKEGELGEDEITVTHTIENGKVVKSEEGKPVRTKDPVKRIVRVGKKPANPTEGETSKTIEREIPYETKVIYDETLESGTQKIENEGKAGKEEVTITQKVKDSKPVGEATETTKTITEKEDRVVRVGVKPVEKIVELGNNTEYRHNPELEAGEEKVIEDGSKGSVKYTTTFNKKTGKLEVTEERVEPKNKIVEYGSKTEDEFTYESEQAFDTKIVEDSNLEAGKTVVDQEGVTGRTKTTVKIENGKKVSENTETIVEKQDKIVRVGTKSVCEIPPVKQTEGETSKTIERDIPFEIKVIYDENLEAGSQVIEKEGKAGKEEVTITQKVKDSKPVGEATETTKTITKKEDMVVRVGVKPVEKIVELGNNTEYRHNPKLKAGETNTIEEGSKGSVKYTTTFNKETGKLEVTEERVEPKNKVVEYGTKTNGEFTYESEKAFDIKVIEDPDLEAGKVVVDQEGVVGKTKTTVKIVNSEKVSEETETLVEKQDKIVRVGTKNVCPIPGEDPEEPDKPVDPEDPEKPGEDKPDPEKPGEDKPDPEKPGEDKPDPEKPGEDKPNPEKPGEDKPNPEKPGEDKPNPEKPDEDKPEYPRPSYQWPWNPRPNRPYDPDKSTPNKLGENTPSEPSDKTPNKPEDKTSNKIVENPSEEPKDPQEESPVVSNTEDVKDTEDVREETYQEDFEDDNTVENKTSKRKEAKVGDKAPNTQDPGIIREIASAGIASGLLLLLRRFKRRK